MITSSMILGLCLSIEAMQKKERELNNTDRDLVLKVLRTNAREYKDTDGFRAAMDALNIVEVVFNLPQTKAEDL